MNVQLYFAEIMPNIYWTYHYSSISYQSSHKDFITKICQNNGIKEIIKIDSNSTLWKRYENDNINKDDFLLLDKLLNNIHQKITFNYNNRIPTLIISISNNDIALASIIHFFHYNTKLSVNIIIDSLKYKIANLPELGTKIILYLQKMN